MNDGATLPLLLKELRLPSMGKLWKELALQAKDKGWSPSRRQKERRLDGERARQPATAPLRRAHPIGAEPNSAKGGAQHAAEL